MKKASRQPQVNLLKFRNFMLRFITANDWKFKEIRQILAPIKVKQVKLNLDEIQELDPHKIIRHKLKEALKHEKGEFIIEDDSLYLECLGGKLPGPLIKWFNDTLGNEGMAELVKKMGNNKASVKSLIGYAKSSNQILFFEADLKGKIVSPKGKRNFGYDPIFIPDSRTQTFAEMKSQDKHKISTRGVAARKLKKFLLQNEKRQRKS